MGIYPKILLSMQSKPLIWYPIEAMAAAGVRQIAVVIGCRASEGRQAYLEKKPTDFSRFRK